MIGCSRNASPAWSALPKRIHPPALLDAISSVAIASARFQLSEGSVFRPGIMPGTFQERARIWIRQSDVTLIQS